MTTLKSSRICRVSLLDDLDKCLDLALQRMCAKRAVTAASFAGVEGSP